MSIIYPKNLKRGLITFIVHKFLICEIIDVLIVRLLFTGTEEFALLLRKPLLPHIRASKMKQQLKKPNHWTKPQEKLIEFDKKGQNMDRNIGQKLTKYGQKSEMDTNRTKIWKICVF